MIHSWKGEAVGAVKSGRREMFAVKDAGESVIRNAVDSSGR